MRGFHYDSGLRYVSMDFSMFPLFPLCFHVFRYISVYPAGIQPSRPDTSSLGRVRVCSPMSCSPVPVRLPWSTRLKYARKFLDFCLNRVLKKIFDTTLPRACHARRKSSRFKNVRLSLKTGASKILYQNMSQTCLKCTWRVSKI